MFKKKNRLATEWCEFKRYRTYSFDTAELTTGIAILVTRAVSGEVTPNYTACVCWYGENGQ